MRAFCFLEFCRQQMKGDGDYRIVMATSANKATTSVARTMGNLSKDYLLSLD